MTAEMTTVAATRAPVQMPVRSGSAARAFAGLLAALSLAGGLALAANHPLGAAPALAAVGIAAALAASAPLAGIALVLALLPLIGLAPWSGWLTVEELDLLVLAVAGGGWARKAVDRDGVDAGTASRLRPGTADGPADRLPAVAIVLPALVAAVLVVAGVRGVLDAGGWRVGWWQGLREPMNALRIGKSLFEAALLLPLWHAARRHAPARAMQALIIGTATGLAGAALAVAWERFAFVGLLDFSSDYRATALFWEMSVGGAVLDGYLALTVPFAVCALASARTPARWLVAASVLLLAGYATLTTFSRITYLALPVGLALTVWLHGRKLADDGTATTAAGAAIRHAGAPSPPPAGSAVPPAHDGAHPLVVLPLAMLFAAAAAWTFPTSGYRGLLALLGATGAMVALGDAARRLRRRSTWAAALALGMLLTGAVAAASWALPKGAYLAWTAMAALAFVAAARLHGRESRDGMATAAIGVAAFTALLAATVLVARHWGGPEAFSRMLPAVVGLALGLGAAARAVRPLWPQAPRWQATTLAALTVVGAAVAAFGGGVYMSDRFSASRGDFGLRMSHWRQAAALLRTPGELLLGRGLGRFPDAFAFAMEGDIPGDHRLKIDGGDGNAHLVLAGGRHMMGWGELYRVSQRAAAPQGPVTVRFAVRSDKPVDLHFEVCEKHLLYSGACLAKGLTVAPQPGAVWTPGQVTLDGSMPTRGAWFAPRMIVFSMAVGSQASVADLDRVEVTDGQGNALVVNGDFSGGLAHWYATSDRLHIPWHAKNLALGILVEQGIVGLAALGLLTGAALWRVTVGAARRDPLAPPLAGALTGFLVVSAFDTLLDAPRLAFLFYLLAGIALGLPAARTATPSRRPGHSHPTAAVAAVGLVVLVASITLMPTPTQAQVSSPALQTSAVTEVIRVGPQRMVKTIAEAARLAGDGTTVEVDAGEYRRDVAVWLHNDLTLRAVGGRVRLVADGAAADGKAIWVVRGQRVVVQGFDFEGAAVPDRNGAGIRFERGSLTVRDCTFLRNETGLLTGNDPTSTLVVEDSEFAHNRRLDGHNHNLYVGTIAEFTLVGSYLHHATAGHLLKSRAAVSRVLYSRLTDEVGGSASYELEFPDGGQVTVIGTVVAQTAATQNPALVSFGAEGLRHGINELVLVHNTFVAGNVRGATLLRVREGTAVVRAMNNLWVGAGAMQVAAPFESRNDFTIEPDSLRAPSDGDFRLVPSSPLRGRAVDPGRAEWRAVREFRLPHTSAALPRAASHPGAVQR